MISPQLKLRWIHLFSKMVTNRSRVTNDVQWSTSIGDASSQKVSKLNFNYKHQLSETVGWVFTELQVDFHHWRTPRWEYQWLSSTTHSSFPLFNQSVHLKRISLFWDFNPVSELISETQGLEEGTDGASKPLNFSPALTITPTRHQGNQYITLS